jgi:Domain of unknown function (DUF4129)
MTAALLAVLLAAPLDLAGYRAQLQRIDALLAHGEKASAAAAARALLGEPVRAEAGELAPDAWTLAPIARGDPHRARLRALIESLSMDPGPAPGADRALLEEVLRAQEWRGPAEGGEIEALASPAPSLFEQVVRWSKVAWRWIRKCLSRAWNWLWKLFPDQAVHGPAAGARITVLVLAGVGVILAAVLGLALFQLRWTPPAPAPAAARRDRAADDDPLSRSAAGWEQRARELAAQGLSREAIRAWYHALLVHCYRTGVLSYRRGRTNWEYAHALAPSLPWRPRFEELTRRFDLEWYGRSESTAEALDAFANGAAEIARALGSRA